MSIEETLDRLASNVALLTGAVATLAESVNGGYEKGKPIYSQQPSTPPGEAPAASSGKKSRAKPATAAAASPAKSEQEDLFGESASTATAAGSSTPKETSAPASAPDDDLFGEKAAPAKEEAKKPATIEQLRTALTQVQTKHGHKDHALGVLKKHTRDGNATISTLDESKYQDVIDACAKYVPAK